MSSPALSINYSSQTQPYILIHVCPVCGQRRQSTARLSGDHLGYLFKFPHGNLINLPYVICPVCNKEMWLEKIRDMNGKTLLDSKCWYIKELIRMRKI